jgi:acyl carrier protein
LYETLKDLLVNELQMRAEDITSMATCSEVGLDSLAVIELSAVLNSRLGIKIHDYELLELGTVGDIASLMEKRRFGVAGGPVEQGWR